jgi:copper chaperone CopZ
MKTSRLAALILGFGVGVAFGGGSALACGGKDVHADGKTCGEAVSAGKAPHTLVMTSAQAVANQPGVKKATFEVQGVTCDSCRNHITTALMQVDGVTAVEFVKKTAFVSYTEAKVQPAALAAAIKEAGYEATIPGSSKKTTAKN